MRTDRLTVYLDEGEVKALERLLAVVKLEPPLKGCRPVIKKLERAVAEREEMLPGKGGRDAE